MSFELFIYILYTYMYKNFHYIAQANKNQPSNIIDIIIMMLVNYKTFLLL